MSIQVKNQGYKKAASRPRPYGRARNLEKLLPRLLLRLRGSLGCFGVLG